MPVQTRLVAADGTLSQVAIAVDAEAVAVPIFAEGRVPQAEIQQLLPFTLAELAELHGVKGEPGETVAASVRLGDKLRELVLYGTGDGSPGALRKAGAALARYGKGKGKRNIAVGVPGEVEAFTEGVLLASYTFKIGEPAKKAPLETLTVLTEGGPEQARPAIERGTVRARATALARDLANMPSGEKSPAWLAEQAQQVAAEGGLAVRVRDETDLRAEGFGGILAVGAGSARPPRLIELTYDPGNADRHVVLVGKGITFDSGGLSLKPADAMTPMKTDMAGGGTVIAVMSALKALGVSVRVTGLISAAENMPSGSAMRPGDVIKHYGGKTSEVLNTDAEGRLVLADALAYADTVLEPDLVVDIATLTGAAKIALGLKHGALFATDDDLANALTSASSASGEALWRLPLTLEYREAIESEVADVANIERKGFGGGSIMAALFLREFVGNRPWAHLDVAGPARAGSDEAEITKGATGFGTRLLLTWLTTTS
jgi:leucyl aminopeptidase